MRSTVESMRAAVALAYLAAPRLLVARVLLTVVSGAVPIAVAWLLKVVLDRLTQGGPVLGPVLALAGVGMAAVLMPQITRFADTQMQRSVSLVARERLYTAVGRQEGLRRLENSQFHDRLQLAAEAGPSGPSEVIGSTLGVAQGTLALVGFLAALTVLNPWMLVVVLVAAVPTLRAEMLLRRHRAKLIAKLGQSWRRELFYKQLLTSPTAAKEVRLYGLTGLFGARMVTELRQIHGAYRRMDLRELAVQGLLGLLGALVAGAGLVWAIDAARAGRLTVGDVSVFVAAVAGVQTGLSLATHNFGRAHEAMLLFGHYQYIVDADPDLPPPPAPQRGVPSLRQGIELRDVWFRYADDAPWALRGVNLTIPAGRATALVGRHGAGKSTVVKLLCRFYDPTRGAVLWDGIDLRELPVEELRRRIGAVFQDFMEYELTAADNIGVGDLGALDDRVRIIAAARRAGVHETLSSLPRGYDTMLTRVFTDLADRDDPGTGVVLSGGQWQRVALARALLRNDSDLLILDEPSAGLDAEAEHEVHTRLREHRRGRTSLLISHRLSTVREADSIVVLADGVVVEQGTHAALLDADGTYARLFALQAAGYRDEIDAAYGDDPDEARRAA